MEEFHVIFSDLPDPRDCTSQHDLTELLVIALAASLCGAQNCSEMAEFGVAKEALLRRFLTLKHGIPSHDTFNRVFRLLDPQAFAEAFQRFMAAFAAAAGLAGGGAASERCSMPATCRTGRCATAVDVAGAAAGAMTGALPAVCRASPGTGGLRRGSLTISARRACATLRLLAL